MSIFEPIPRESRVDEGTQELDGVPSDDDSAHPAGSFDPRSIRIAGLVVAGIVATGLIVSNMAQPEPRTRPAVASRVDPGAAAVEQAEAKQNVPTAGPSASPSTEPVETDDSDAEDSPAWQSPDDSNDSSSGDSKWDSKPGKGRGRGRG